MYYTNTCQFDNLHWERNRELMMFSIYSMPPIVEHVTRKSPFDSVPKVKVMKIMMVMHTVCYSVMS